MYITIILLLLTGGIERILHSPLKPTSDWLKCSVIGSPELSAYDPTRSCGVQTKGVCVCVCVCVSVCFHLCTQVCMQEYVYLPYSYHISEG